MSKTEIKKPILRRVSRNQMKISQRLDDMIQAQIQEMERKSGTPKSVKTS